MRASTHGPFGAEPAALTAMRDAETNLEIELKLSWENYEKKKMLKLQRNKRHLGRKGMQEWSFYVQRLHETPRALHSLRSYGPMSLSHAQVVRMWSLSPRISKRKSRTSSKATANRITARRAETNNHLLM